MIYLSGIPHPRISTGKRPDLGVLITPNMGNRPAWLNDVPHAFDNGMFSAPEKFSLPAYLEWLQSMADYRAGCLFVTAPDVVGDAIATAILAAPALPKIREVGYLAALVAQDGLEDMRDEIDWGSFDALFIGGSTEWKLSCHARSFAEEARQRGKWVHMGRVNSYTRLRLAKDWGCHSADGTYLRSAPDENFGKMISWLNRLRDEPNFFDDRIAA